MAWIGTNQDSFGARRVADALRQLNLRWYGEHADILCYTHRTCPFDFAVWRDGKLYLIEFDGEQHGFMRTHRDLMKEGFCVRNNIPLLILREADLFGGRLEWLLSDFVNRMVYGKQGVNMTQGTRRRWWWSVVEPP